MSLEWLNPYAKPGTDDDLSGALFDSMHWAAAVACLGARCWRGIDRGNGRLVTLFVWHRGPVRVGYLGFPVSPGWLLRDAEWQDCVAPYFPERIDFVRANFSTLHGPSAGRGRQTMLPESVIPALSSWPQRNQRKIRKDLAHAARHGLTIANATPEDAEALFSIYQQTIVRRRGRLRYTGGYFSELIAISRVRQDIQVRLACHEGNTIGFCVTADNTSRGYYLHAGVAEGNRHLGAADLLADDAIRWAAARGCVSFSLMASPADQVGLHKFKQKWAEQDGQWSTIDVARGLLGKLTAFALARGN